MVIRKGVVRWKRWIERSGNDRASLVLRRLRHQIVSMN